MFFLKKKGFCDHKNIFRAKGLFAAFQDWLVFALIKGLCAMVSSDLGERVKDKDT